MAVLLAAGLLPGCGDDGPAEPDRQGWISALNGLYYKGLMGDTVADSLLQFEVFDENGNRARQRPVQLQLLSGDGTLSDSQMTTDSTGLAGFWYAFTGDSGHADIRLMTADAAPLVIKLRADVLLPGPGGQGQYIRFSDTYAEVRKFNGDPASVDAHPQYWIVYANYESALGVVVVMDDHDRNNAAADGEPVVGVIVNTVYQGTTTDSIPVGIGTTIADLRTIYGDPDEVVRDNEPPPATRIKYDSLQLTLYGDLTDDTTIFEMHLAE